MTCDFNRDLEGKREYEGEEECKAKSRIIQVGGREGRTGKQRPHTTKDANTKKRAPVLNTDMNTMKNRG